jgi:hypothetical protein
MICLAAATALLTACSSVRNRPYDDEDLRTRARPDPEAAAFMGYHGPVDRQVPPGEKQ